MQVVRTLPEAQQALQTAAALVQARLESDSAWLEKQFEEFDAAAPGAEAKMRQLEARRVKLLEVADLLEACAALQPAADALQAEYLSEVEQAAYFAGLALAARYQQPVPSFEEAAAIAGKHYLPRVALNIQRFINSVTERRKAA
jgi:hypothetical protein